MTDRATKILLFVIAIGIWANVTVSLVQSRHVSAQGTTLSDIDDHLSSIPSIDDHLSSIDNHLEPIESDVHDLTDIGDGTCTNGRICQ